jgi:ApaG protein
MSSILTCGVKVIVESFYQPEYSNPFAGEYMFAYRITIENHNPYAIRLLKRHWQIFDSIGGYKAVDGDGVIGVQPIIQPGEYYQYTSGSNLQSEVGQMEGYYVFENLNNLQQFRASIPRFGLIAPFKHN